MSKITESEYLAALDLCRRYVSQCQDDIEKVKQDASNFEGIEKLGLSTSPYNGLRLMVRAAENPSEEFAMLKRLTKKDFHYPYGLGPKSRKEIFSKLAVFGIVIK